MTVALLMIGTELTRGEIVDTNSAWLAAELTAAGFDVARIDTVPDDLDVIAAAIRTLAAAHPLVIATGGLGPTTDDLTAAAAARAAGVSLTRHEPSLEAIRRRVAARGGPMTPGHEKQADLPAGSRALPNAEGTAPGFAVTVGEATAFFLPGVPHEMKRMFADHVLPSIRGDAPRDTHQVRLGIYGLGEAAIGQRLEGLEAAFPGLTLGYRAHFPEVEVKVHVRAANEAIAVETAARAAAEVRARLGDAVFGEGGVALPEAVAAAVRARGWRLALAESCTGGLVAHLLTRDPASDYLLGGAVTYANELKVRVLGVLERTLAERGAVSAEVASEMAAGARAAFASDAAIAITGIAGPTGGSAEKPVGLCYFAVAHPEGIAVRRRVFPGERRTIQLGVAYAALDLLRRIAEHLPESPTA